ncbi:MAG: tetratricopeptide repeat protein, partial [Chthoniobacteraceae bacterium]
MPARLWKPLLGAALFVATLPAYSEEAAAVAPPATASPEAVTEIAGYAKLARKAADEDKWPLADHFLGLVAAVDAPDIAKKAAFRSLAEDYEQKGQFSRAIAVYEKMTAIYLNEPDTPEIIFRVGLLYRRAGVPKLAVARFYTVLNSALKFGAKDLEGYRALARRAQWEIAETSFQTGDFKKAHKYYDLLSRLEMPAPEMARTKFRLTHCLILNDETAKAITAAEAFLQAYPEDESAAECRYLLASALREQGRHNEAFDAVLALLRLEDGRKEMTPEKWIYWKKKAGNEFANSYYQKGDAMSALTIFQSIARLGEEPEWQWPVIYPMGLCFEKLRHAGRAAE